MRLLELTPEETAFLAATDSHTLHPQLTRRLAMTLSARLRLPVTMRAAFAEVPAEAPATPHWQPDGALAALWLVRRLGGQRPEGAAPFVPGSLIRTLDTVLAECWLDATAQLPAAITWTLASDFGAASLVLHRPHASFDMTRWAREVARHG